MRASRTIRIIAAVIVSVTVATACGGNEGEDRGAPAMSSGVYFGTVAMTTDRVAVALEDGQGRQRVRAFVADGEPGGDAEWFDGAGSRSSFSLTSASGKARIEGEVRAEHVHGTLTLADGKARAFYTIPATHGAGIYDVTVSADGRYSGTATDGSRLEGRKDGNFVQGTITPKVGDSIGYKVTDVSRAFGYNVEGGQPDGYTLVVSRYGLVQIGRGGGERLKSGTPNGNIVSLDLAPTPIPTPGVYYGKLALTTDQMVLVVDQPSGQASRRVRVYLSDGEPEPEGDIEWFTGPVQGSRLDLTSASGEARLTGELTDDFAAGTVTLPGNRSHRFYAVPGGDGAGIYDVTVTADKAYRGTSENGGSFEIRQTDDRVQGTITTAEGRRIQLLAYDLTRVFPYGVEGSKPDTYVAFATPGGRYLIGRSGNVRGRCDPPCTNIIGLDKAC